MVKTTEVRGERGFEDRKLITGRKRQIVVDSLGLVLLTVVHAASISDTEGGIEV